MISILDSISVIAAAAPPAEGGGGLLDSFGIKWPLFIAQIVNFFLVILSRVVSGACYGIFLALGMFP